MRRRRALVPMLTATLLLVGGSGEASGQAENGGAEGRATHDGGVVTVKKRSGSGSTPHRGRRRAHSHSTCDYRRIELPAGAVSVMFGSQPGGEGSWFRVECDNALPVPGLDRDVDIRWIPRRAPAPRPREVAEEAVSQLRLEVPELQMSPPPDRLVVRFPTLVWIKESDWGPQQVTASVSGVSATATAVPRRLIVDMGDGTTITCAGPGVPYDPNKPEETQDRSCAHSYTRSSAGEPGNAYRLRASVEWALSWSASGASGGGELGTVSRTSTVRARVGEIQALIVSGGSR